MAGVQQPPVVQGDARKRIQVPLPQSLEELNFEAERFFGHPGELKLYHKGRDLITNNEHLARVRPNDVIVITWGDRQLTPGEVSQLYAATQAASSRFPMTDRSTYKDHYDEKDLPGRRLPAQEDRSAVVPTWEQGDDLFVTTNKATFVAHRVEPAPPQPRQPAPRAGLKLDDRSTYKEDFVKQPLPARPKPPPVEGTRATGFPQEDPDDSRFQSTYSSSFAYRGQGDRATLPRPEPGPSPAFEGDSTYRRDFVPSDGRPEILPPWSPKQGNNAFDGTTTYRSHHTGKAPPPVSPAGARPEPKPEPTSPVSPKTPTSPTSQLPLEGASEYKTAYLRREAERPWVFLEPDLGHTAEVPFSVIREAMSPSPRFSP